MKVVLAAAFILKYLFDCDIINSSTKNYIEYFMIGGLEVDNKCSKCGGELISGRFSTGAHLLGVTPIEDAKKIKPRYSSALCDVCAKCGNIENIRAEEPEKLK